MPYFLHIASGRVGSLLGCAPALARMHVGGVPIPPVLLRMGFFVRVVMLGGFVQQLRKRCDIHGFEQTSS
jgi:hypothetical protein